MIESVSISEYKIITVRLSLDQYQPVEIHHLEEILKGVSGLYEYHTRQILKNSKPIRLNITGVDKGSGIFDLGVAIPDLVANYGDKILL